MAYTDFISIVHKSTSRDYLARVTEHDKAECAELAIKFDVDYWDGERHTGYGGYNYDGRWRKVADAMVAHYGLKEGDKILDVGVGKGFLLYEFTQAVPGIEVVGLDISTYALKTAKEEVRDSLVEGTAAKLPWPDDHFDLVFSINTLHNLYNYDIWAAFQEMERVGKGAGKYFCVEAYRNEREKMNLMYWQLTCRAFHTPEEWQWLIEQTGYNGDHSFIYFE